MQLIKYARSFSANRSYGRRDALSDRAYILANSQPEPNSGCWLWLGRLNTSGYGVGRFRDGTAIASRLAFIAFRDLIPDRALVRHSCDNPICVNPDHLFLGTTDDNMKDKVRRHRQVRGERHNSAKLTEKMVREIRELRLTGAVLSIRYGVSQEMISRIKRGKSWRHVQ